MPLTRAWLSRLLVASHEAHETVRLWATERSLLISGHALAETYSVLTGLPGDARVGPSDAVMLIDENFAGSLALPPEMASGLIGISLVLASRAGRRPLATYVALMSAGLTLRMPHDHHALPDLPRCGGLSPR